MPTPAGSKNVTFGVDLLAATEAYCHERGERFTDVVREAVARRIKRADLARGVKRGRPRKATAK